MHFANAVRPALVLALADAAELRPEGHGPVVAHMGLG
jgi:hypothetical protein